MKTQNHLLSKVCLMALIGNVWFIQAQQQKNKHFDVFQHKKGHNSKKALAPDAKTATVVHPGKSANYFWNNNNSQWMFNDTSVYGYNSQSWLISETHQLNTPLNRYLITYDNKARITQRLNQNWNSMSNTWEDFSREVFVYDANDNRTE